MALASSAGAQALSDPPPPPFVDADAGEPETADAGVATPLDAGTPAAPEGLSTVTFKDGQRLTGVLITQLDGQVTLKLGTGQKLILDRDSIASIDSDTLHHVTSGGKVWFDDPNRTRYFFSPSAVMLKKGEAHFSQKELAISSFAYGIIDYFSVELSSCIPAFFAGTNGINLLLSLKAGGQVGEKVWLAVGTQALSLPGVFNSGSGSGLPVGGLYFGSITYGDRDFQLTLSAGMPYFLKPPQLFYPIITVSGSVRLSELVAVMSENWFLIDLDALGQGTNDRWVLAQILGVRLMGQHFATDLGFILIEDNKGLDPVPFPIPWVDFTYNF